MFMHNTVDISSDSVPIPVITTNAKVRTEGSTEVTVTSATSFTSTTARQPQENNDFVSTSSSDSFPGTMYTYSMY